MNRQIRTLGIAALAIFILLFVQLSNIQVLSAKRLKDNRLNTRQAVKDFSQPRGAIQTADAAIRPDRCSPMSPGTSHSRSAVKAWSAPTTRNSPAMPTSSS